MTITEPLPVAVGHIPETPLPVQTGNVGVAAHRDTFFRGLRDLRADDKIQFSTASGDFGYEVESLNVVEPDNVKVLGPLADNVLTLVTCFPFTYIGNAPKPFVVRARQVSPEARAWSTVERGVAAGSHFGVGGSVQKIPQGTVARILVVEDNASDVFLLERALEKQDLAFELMHLLNGGEALAFIRREGRHANSPIPNLILVDLNLSKYTGEDILREIGKAAHLTGIPVCVWSSSRSMRDQALLRNLGATQFLAKPSGLDQFMEIGKTLKDLLNGRNGG